MYFLVQIFDVIVLGVGGMGSSACYHLVKKKIKVLAIEQFKIGHNRGSSHGQTRMIRKAYFEHPDYVPLLERAYELWFNLERESGSQLFHKTGVLYFGPQRSIILRGISQSAKLHKLCVQHLENREVRSAYSMFSVPPSYRAILEPEAGFLEVENCVKVYTTLAKKHGVKIRQNETVQTWSGVGDHIEVKTDKGKYCAPRLVITTGAWRNEKIEELSSLSVHRNVLFWFPAGKMFKVEMGLPCFACDLPYGFFYGFPKMDHFGIKIACHSPGKRVLDPYRVQRRVMPGDLHQVSRFVKAVLPSIALRPSKSSVCMYTMSPDENFVIDLHPKFENVVFAAGFSGHGFKFASVVGEILSDLVLEGKTRLPIEFLKLRRWGLK